MIIDKHSQYGATNQEPNTIVVHAMGEYIMGTHALEFLANQQLSVHAMAAPDGTIYRCRNDDEGAYHARGFNTNTLGIEVLVAGDHDYASFLEAIKKPYMPDEQYRAVIDQCRMWMSLNGITRIVRHSDLSPGRKVDPGKGFPWQKFLEDLKSGI